MKTFRSFSWVAAFAAVLCAGAAFAQDAPAAKPADAKARIKAISSRLEDLVGVRGAERTAALELAAREFEAIAAEFPTDKALVAQANWEAGECWRRAERIESASAAYGRVLDSGDVRFRQRALFQRAGMLRRGKQLEEAQKLYAEAGAIEPESVRAHDARLWVARVLEMRGENDAAVEAYRKAVASATGARRIIEASDALAKLLVRRGDLEGARAAIAHAEQAAAGEIEAGGEDAERIQKALEEMSARGMLRRATDKSTEAGKAAEDVEVSRGR